MAKLFVGVRCVLPLVVRKPAMVAKMFVALFVELETLKSMTR